GFLEALKGLSTNTDMKSLAVVLGAGGATPAVCFALHKAGYQKIIVANRTIKKAQILAEQLSFISESCSWDDIDDFIPDADILVNCTSLGMSGSGSLDVDLAYAKENAIVADIIYTPLETNFIKAGRERGLRTTNGLSMLMYQAITGFYSWYDKSPAVSVELEVHLRNVLEKKHKPPIKIGLTGSIGMGKSTAAKVFAEMGAHVWDADGAVHRLYQKGGAAVPELAEHFPDVITEDAVSRDLLSKHLMKNPDDFKLLEELVHPLVEMDRETFIEGATEQNAAIIVLDVPLLFETGQSHHFDEVVVVTADPEVRKTRVLERPGMTEEKLTAIISRQMGEKEKVLLADHVIRTDGTREQSAAEIRDVFHKILDNSINA
ncbi:MAG: dephospho-CoA kinase, partial [Aquisalinus sp.]|nr:dephospho-CoA kinase [Aquisalinus sp.]